MTSTQIKMTVDFVHNNQRMRGIIENHIFMPKEKQMLFLIRCENNAVYCVSGKNIKTNY